MLQYSDVSIDLVFEDIATTPLELRPSVKVTIRESCDNRTGNETSVEDGVVLEVQSIKVKVSIKTNTQRIHR